MNRDDRGDNIIYSEECVMTPEQPFAAEGQTAIPSSVPPPSLSPALPAPRFALGWPDGPRERSTAPVNTRADEPSNSQMPDDQSPHGQYSCRLDLQ